MRKLLLEELHNLACGDAAYTAMASCSQAPLYCLSVLSSFTMELRFLFVFSNSGVPLFNGMRDNFARCSTFPSGSVVLKPLLHSNYNGRQQSLQMLLLDAYDFMVLPRSARR